MNTEFDVFVSYSSRDRALVERIAQRLRDARLRPWFDRWTLTAGRSWQEEIAAGIAASRVCAVCIGPGDVGDWSREELEIALVRAANDRGFRVFVVLLPGVGDAFDPARLSPFLVTRTWVDLRGGLGDLQPLINAVRGVPATSGGAPAPASAANPYRGLRPFEEHDADLFFGRTSEIQRGAQKLRAGRFLAVVGASGSGKSSLVRAGLVPELRAGHGWAVRVFKPGAAPLEALAVQVARDADVRGARGQMRAGVDGLHLLGRVALADAGDDARLLVVVDQFEELFTRCRDEDERRRFVENLVYAATAPDGRIVVVLTLRADFYPRCAAYPELAHLVTGQQLLLGPMSAEALREAIEAPARGAGGEFESGLVDLLLREVEGRPGALPLLEHLLYELWEHRSGRMLTLEAYQRAGGVSGAVAVRAEAVFTGLDSEEQAIARRVLLRLTEPGEGTEDTRRRAEFDELVRSRSEQSAVAHVVGALADARLLTTSEGVVDVAHEALIRGWPRLRGWIDEGRDSLRIHRRLAETAEEWERLDRDPGLLFRGARLVEARALDPADLNQRERAFLAASGAQEVSELEQVRELAETRRRATRRLVWAAAILLAGVAVSTVAAVLALRARDQAEAQTTTALARQLMAQSRERRETDVEAALLSGLIATHLRPAPETQAVLVDALGVEPRLVALLGRLDRRLTALAADDRAAVTVEHGGQVQVWDLRRPRTAPVRLQVGPHVVSAVSADLGTLAVADDRNRVRLWDLERRAPIGRPARMISGKVLGFDLSGAGGYLAVSDTETGSSVWRLGERPARLDWVRARRGGRALVSGDDRRVAIEDARGLVIRELATRRVIARHPGLQADDLPLIASDGRYLFVSEGEQLTVRDFNGRALGRPLETAPTAVAPDAGLALASGADGPELVSLRTGRREGAALRGIAFGGAFTATFAGRSRMLTVSTDGTMALWDQGRVNAIPRRRWNPRAAVVLDGGHALLKSPLRLIDHVTGKVRATLAPPDGLPVPASWHASADGRYLAGFPAEGGGQDASALLWDTGSSAPPRAFPHAPHPLAVTFAVNSRWLAGLAEDGSLTVWNLPSLQVKARFRVDDPIAVQLASSADGRGVLVLDFFGRNLRFDVDERTTRAIDGQLQAMAADGRVAAGIDAGQRLFLWRSTGDGWTRDGTPIMRAGVLNATLALNADGRLLAVEQPDGRIALWDTRARVRLADVDAGGSGFSWSGSRLVTRHADGGAVTWDVSLAAARRRACAVLNRTPSRAEWTELVGRDQDYAKLC